MFCEETLGKIKHRAFSKRVGPEFYRLKALITLEQVNTTEWWEKIRILIGKTAMVGCCKLSLYANVMSVELIASSFLDLISKQARVMAAVRAFLFFEKKTNSGSKTRRVMEKEQHTAKFLNGR